MHRRLSKSPTTQRETFNRLYRELSPRVLGYLLRRMSSRTDAEDVLQETFLAAYKGQHHYRGTSQPLAWLLGIARRLRGRISREPELAQEWEAIQSLYGQLRTMANVHPVPPAPAWSTFQEKGSIVTGKLVVVLTTIAISALVIGWVAYNLPLAEKKATELSPVPPPNLYNTEAAPEPIPYNERLKSRTVEGMGMVADMHTQANLGWKASGNVRVKVTYFDGTSRTLVSHYTQNKALLKRLKELGIPFSPKDTLPVIRWSQGKRIKNKLTRLRPLQALPDGVTRSIETWVKREADGRLVGYGTHQIKDGDGKVLATLVVEPLPVQLRHDRPTSHRRAEK